MCDIPDVPSYEFACPCGHREDRITSILEAPPLGSAVQCPACRRSTLARQLSVPTIADSALRASIAGYPYVSRRHGVLPGCRTDAKGQPIVESPRHEREIMARTGLVRE